VLEQTPDGVSKRDKVELVEKWRADQILTDLLELPTTRSPEVERKIKRFQELSQNVHDLPAQQKQEYEQLRLWVEDLPPALEDQNERRQAEAIQAAANRSAELIKELE